MPDSVEDLSNVPASVLKQQRDADAKIKAAKEVLEDPNPAQPAEELNTDLNPAQPAPAIPKVEPTLAPAQPAISDGTTQDGQWEHKYSVLQGKYNKEVGDLKGMIVDMQSQMERQNQVIEGMNSNANTSPVKDLGDDLNPEDFSGWGDEMKLMVDQVNALKTHIAKQDEALRNASSNAAPADGGLQTRIESLESEANDTRSSTYLKFLDDNIKGEWRVLNKDTNFNTWIDQTDPISLQPRRALLVAAATALRGDQVASIFNLYISANLAGTLTIADELPGGAGNGAPDNIDTVTGTSQEQVAQAQKDFVQGKITEEEYDKVFSQFQLTLKRQQQS
jgi:hypothetical protein